MENEIIEMIRTSSDPEKALSIAIELAIALTTAQCCSIIDLADKFVR